MAETLGTIRGQISLDVKQALAAYTQTRLAHLNTVTALHTGAGAMIQSGAAIAGVGAIMVGGFVKAVSAAATFERKLDAFSAVSNSTQAEYEGIRKKALQLGADTIFSADQIADSFIELGKSGVTAKAIIDGVGDATTYLAAATDIPLTTSAEILSNTLNTFSISATQAKKVADQLSGAANSSSINVQDLGVSMKYVGGIAASAGISFSQTNTALALLGKVGIKGSTAGTSLRQVIAALPGPTDKSAAALKSLGIIAEDGSNQFYNAAGKLKPLPDILDILNKSLDGKNYKEKTDLLSQIFPIRAMPTILRLLKEGSDGFNDMAANIDKSKAADIAAKRLDNLSGDIEILKGNIDTFVITAGSGFQVVARSVVQSVTQILQKFFDLPKGIQTAIVGGVAAFGGLLIIIGTIGLFAGAILNIIALAIQLRAAMTLVKTTIMAFAAAQRIAAIATAIWNAVLAANPIVLIIIAIVALVAALIWFFTQTKLGREIWANFVAFLTAAWANIVSVATTVFSALGAFFTAVWNGIVSVTTSIWNGIVAFFVGVWNGIVQAFLNFTLLGIIISHFTQIRDFIVGIWNGIAAFFTAVWTAIMTAAQPFINFFNEYLGPMFAAFGGLVAAIFNFIWQSIVFVFTTIVAFVTPIVTAMVDFVVGYFTFMGNTISAILNLIGGIISATWNFIVGVVSAAVGFVVNVISAGWNAAMAVISGVMNAIRGVISAAWAAISSVVSSAVSRVASVISAGWSALTGVVSAIFNAVKNAIKVPLDAAVDYVRSILDKIKAVFSGASNLLVSAGKNIVEGLINGIKAAIGGVTATLKGLTDLIPKSKGPEEVDKKLLTPNGKLIMQSLMVGLESMYPSLISQLHGFTNAIPTAVNGAVLRTMSAANDLKANVGIGGSSATVTQNLAISGLQDSLQDIRDNLDRPNVNIDIDNPAPEPASTSLPKSLRQATYMVG